MKQILFFCDPACRPCALLYPIVEKVAKQARIELKKIEILDNLEMLTKYGITSIPQVLVVENNNVNGRLVGLKTENEVLQLLKESEIKSK